MKAQHTYQPGDIVLYQTKACVIVALVDDITVRIIGPLGESLEYERAKHPNRFLALLGMKQKRMVVKVVFKTIDVSCWMLR